MTGNSLYGEDLGFGTGERHAFYPDDVGAIQRFLAWVTTVGKHASIEELEALARVDAGSAMAMLYSSSDIPPARKRASMSFHELAHTEVTFSVDDESLSDKPKKSP